LTRWQKPCRQAVTSNPLVIALIAATACLYLVALYASFTNARFSRLFELRALVIAVLILGLEAFLPWGRQLPYTFAFLVAWACWMGAQPITRALGELHRRDRRAGAREACWIALFTSLILVLVYFALAPTGATGRRDLGLAALIVFLFPTLFLYGAAAYVFIGSRPRSSR